MKKLILADNQDITRYGMRAAVSGIFADVSEVSNRQQLAEHLLLHGDAVAVIDYTLFDCTPEQLLVLKERFPQSIFVLFSDSLSENFLRKMVFSNPTFSVLMKDNSLEEIVSCLKRAADGEPFICARATVMLSEKQPLKQEKEIQPLTLTEKEILRSLSMGKTTKEIAAERFLSVYTVMTHRKNIFRKLQVNNAHEAVRYALRAGIVDSMEYYI